MPTKTGHPTREEQIAAQRNAKARRHKAAPASAQAQPNRLPTVRIYLDGDLAYVTGSRETLASLYKAMGWRTGTKWRPSLDSAISLSKFGLAFISPRNDIDSSHYVNLTKMRGLPGFNFITKQANERESAPQ